MKHISQKTVLAFTTALILLTALYGCNKTKTSGGSAAAAAAGNTAERQRTAATPPPARTEDPVKDWYNPESKVFEISKAGQLAGLAKIVNSGNSFKGKTIIITADIDLSGYHANSSFNEGRGWVPIGSKRSVFKGTFDGNGKVVRGLYINNPKLFYAGLLGRLDSAVVKNLSVTEANITAHSRAGAVAGGIGNSSVEHCYSSGTVKGNGFIGGVVGYSYRRSKVSDSYSESSLGGENYIGGVAGDLDGGSIVERCYSAGKVSGEAAVGGVAGGIQGRGSRVSNSYSTAKIESGSKGGGIAGLVIQGGNIKNCYSTSEVTGRTYIGGIAGQIADTLSNCVALNKSVKATVGVAGRLRGHSDGKMLLKNAAFIGMMNKDGNAEWLNKTDKGKIKAKDGLDITKEQIKADGTFGGLFTLENGWTTEDGKLPGFGSALTLPDHLR
ncbi:MAG: hypothetical protein LBI42_11045 [Chitinispirillales bacterium]|jgi:hypothetical protein|nr:hypothetical protein [Chitinispirillales bacterium]